MNLPGVFIAKKKDGTIYYRASMTCQGKHISLGSFSSETDAHRAYLEAGLLLKNHTLTVDTYESNLHLLSFEKWVILCNYRDNGIYISTPIYIRPKFFYYYFNPHSFFLFSSEDLFYYASHKISKRGGHFFVSDYGMQVSIMSRYGIKNYAVEGKDYVFKNGNSFDFRYENLDILNTYHGVSFCPDQAPNCYITRIHVNGYLKVGAYATAIEAAIAYNKAADLLKKAGINKNFQTNYIDRMSSAAYADLYYHLSISPRITKMAQNTGE